MTWFMYCYINKQLLFCPMMSFEYKNLILEHFSSKNNLKNHSDIYKLCEKEALLLNHSVHQTFSVANLLKLWSK